MKVPSFKPFKPAKFPGSGASAPATKPFLPKGVAGTKTDPRNKFKKSREIGYDEPFDQKTDGVDWKP